MNCPRRKLLESLQILRSVVVSGATLKCAMPYIVANGNLLGLQVFSPVFNFAKVESDEFGGNNSVVIAFQLHNKLF